MVLTCIGMVVLVYEDSKYVKIEILYTRVGEVMLHSFCHFLENGTYAQTLTFMLN